MSHTPTPRLLITPGEPAGIGPDLCVKIAQQESTAELVVIADPRLIKARAAQLQLPIEIDEVDFKAPPRAHRPGHLLCCSVPLARDADCGQLDTRNVPYVLETLQQAVTFCMAGSADALVTGPIHKGIINEAGISFSGHTEYLQALTKSPEPVMMLATPGLRVALATIHIPLRKVSEAITPQRLIHVIKVLESELMTRFGIVEPRILISGLNPHAGEGGHMGREEVDIIEPTLEHLRSEGMQLIGPLPADTLFIPKYLDHADAVLAMYHDQGLPVLKYKGFGQAANITLGLPIIRTSVDHGTALELAGSGQADTGSLAYAIQVALEMVEKTYGA